jgi:predicted glutamine amidotransferase
MSNIHGAGIAWTEHGKLYVEKGFMDWPTFKEFWEARDWSDVPAIVHFRIATHGKIDEDNTHPFWVFPGKLAFAHNGIMSFTKEFETISDTQVFNRYILKQLPRNFLSNSGIRVMMEDYIGTYNKLVFLDNEGSLDIFNESCGEWLEDGCWFSNTHWQPTALANSKWSKKDSMFYNPDDLGKEDEWEDKYGDDYWTDAEEFTGYKPYGVGQLPPFIVGDVYYCCDCADHFAWTKVLLWYDYDGLSVPECPYCFCPEATMAIADEGMTVNGKFISGTLNEDETNDSLDTEAGRSKDA